MPKFLSIFEDKQGIDHFVIFLVASQSTYGLHGEKERAAPDPVSIAEYEFTFNKDFESFVAPLAQLVEYGIYEGGSYHERWYYASARLKVFIPYHPYELEEEFYNKEEECKIETQAFDSIFSSDYFSRKAKFWRRPFISFEASKQELSSVAEDYNSRARDFQSSEDFWRVKTDTAIAMHSLSKPLSGD
jgi:hypothetical protein